MPKKITVTRVAAWRTKDLTGRGVAAFRRAVHADGADKSGLAKLTYAVMINYGTTAALSVALANTLFFSAATAESKAKVALYLAITVAPFAVVAPIIGPLLDRLQRGRRIALAASLAGQGVMCVVMALNFDNWKLYPAALGYMVLDKSFTVLRAAVTPRVLPERITLVTTNSRLTVFGMAASGVFGAGAVGLANAFGSPGALYYTAVLCALGVWLCLRIPAWVEVTAGEVPATLSGHPHKPRRQPMGRSVVVALWGNGTIRLLTGFLTLFSAFVVKAQTEHAPGDQLILLGMIGAAAGVGGFLGNGVGARMHFAHPDRLILACLGVGLGAAVGAAVFDHIAAVVVLALLAATGSALAKVCLDAVIQRDMPEQSRASAFGRSETILQLGWVFGGALGVLLPPTYWIGFTVVAVLLAAGFAQTWFSQRGGTLVPGLGGDRPLHPDVPSATNPATGHLRSA
ncbi:MFS transporter [Pseudonocardiaceae bacterium YIM PH 21723]|nr:MFS transporter [Pseudonocardiaceae bacterium YIM PH 21723]